MAAEKREIPFGPARKRVCVCGYNCTECGKFVGWPSFDSVYDGSRLLCLECFSRTGKEIPRPIVPGLRDGPIKKHPYCSPATDPFDESHPFEKTRKVAYRP